MTNGVGGVGKSGGIPGRYDAKMSLVEFVKNININKKGGSVEIGSTGIRRGVRQIGPEVAKGLTGSDVGMARFLEGWVGEKLTAVQINERLADVQGEAYYTVATDKDGKPLLQQREGQTNFVIRETWRPPLN